MYFRTEGVILARRNLGEADRLLTLYTKDYGKVTCLAKGVRRPRSRKSGHVELGNWCKLFIAQGKNIDLLTEVETKRAFGIANFSPTKANKIYHLLEIVDKLTADRQKNQEVFKLLIEFLARVVRGDDFDLSSSVFKVKILSKLGFFSAKTFTDEKIKKLFTIIEDEDYAQIKEKIRLSQEAYLKLLTFLDSMIEKIIDSKLKTSRFLTSGVFKL